MKTNEILIDLKNKGAELWLEEGKIKYKFPKGLLTQDVKNELISRKEEVQMLLENGLIVNSSILTKKAESVHEPFALSDMQEAYWVGEGSYFDFGKVSAHLYAEYEFNQTNIRNINQAWNILIQRHEMLRSFILPDGHQQILKEVPEYIIIHNDYSNISIEERNKQLQKIQYRMSNEGPKSNQWPLFELQASRVDTDVLILHVSISLIICDGLSAQIIMKEFGELIQNTDKKYLPIEFSYKDYIKALKENEKKPTYQRAKQYWLSRVANFPLAPELPLISSRKVEVPSFTRHSNSMSKEKWQKLKQIASSHKLTPSAFISGVYAYILSKWNRKSHFVINMLYVNRLPLHKDIYNVVGNFSSTILLEVNHTPGQSFIEFSQSLQERLLKDMNHAAYSGVKLIRELNRQHGGSERAAMPIVLASMLFSNFNESGSADYAKYMKPTCSKLQTPQVWLDHQVFEEDGMLKYNWDEANNVFPEGMIRSMFKAYNNLLDELLYNELIWSEPLPQVIENTLLEKRKITNSTHKNLETCLLHELFVKSARQMPDNIAIESGSGKLTYCELDLLSDKVGAYLQKKGVKPNELVAVIMEKGWEQIVAVIGILKSGAAYLPINARVPAEKLHYILQNANVSEVITQDFLMDKLDIPDLFSLNGMGQILNTKSAYSINNQLCSEDNLAYVIYTSGSTGDQKGVMIRHKAVVNTILDVNSRFNIHHKDKFFAISSLNFDLSVYDVFGALAAGGTIVIPKEDELREPSQWLKVVKQSGITVWNSVPALMQMFIEYVDTPSIKLPDGLRLVLLSGDWIPVSLPELIMRLFKNCKVTSLGGATEASIWSIIYPIESVDPTLPSIPYGKALANQKMFVFDENLHYTPDWVTGDIYIGGVGLADGYLNDREKTEGSFIIHPVLNERIYKTGDLGRFLPDGNIEFLGREDFQVKIHGYRIELGEIEAALLKHEDISDAVISVSGNRSDAKRLVGYYVKHKDTSVEKEDLVSFLTKKLPDYMVPGIFIELENLPLTLNGKVDRAALPSRDEIEKQQLNTTEVTPPRNELEYKLYHLIIDLLGLTEICIFDNFFEQGGNSILAIQLLNKIEKEHSVHISMHHFLENPTIADITKLIKTKETTDTISPLVAINKKGNQAPIFMIHPVGGNVMSYFKLSRYLGENQPFFGVQASGLESGDIIQSIEEMAIFYAQEIKKVLTDKAVILGGWSLGAVVALHMAKLFQDENIQVKSLILIDPPIINFNQDNEFLFSSILKYYAKDNNTSFSKLNITEDHLKNLSNSEQLEQFYQKAKHVNLLPEELSMVNFSKMFNVFETNLKAMWQYVAKEFHGNVQLYCATDHDRDWQHAKESWLNILSGNVLIEEYNANHYSIMEEPVIVDIARKIITNLEV